MRPLDFLLAPGHVSDNDNDDGYAASMLNIANEVSAAPRMAKVDTVRQTKILIFTRCIWQLRASSIPTGSGGICSDVRLV